MSAALAQNAPSPSDIVKSFIAAIARKDFDAALRHVADDCEYENMPMAKVRGHAGMRAVLEPFLAPTLENEFVVLREAADGEIVFLERLDRHRLADRWVELPVTGVWEVRGGKIAVWRDYFDLATIMKHWPTA